ncbi:MAG TPA: holo-[acyl-carrier-protein] synthase [candidate division WOR-3 bacterium]|uniref:Holo-[acyl-carrier-protein] synthase n=1 Tax=candidate division WOR-3 bacterium TaxID=2052148 RepID=A0A7V0T676_UNCW3|nr:holo-[acyl-carrier-protein] synthase [candidate division WOR-3 bacterium]
MAVFGLGIDLCNVPRIRAALARFPARFRNRVFTPAEVAFCDARTDPATSYAARFAAKEAFAKALGTGLRGLIGWREIEIRDNERSRPTIGVTGRAAARLAGRPVHLSITHLPEYAAAVVVIEEETVSRRP